MALPARIAEKCAGWPRLGAGLHSLGQQEATFRSVGGEQAVSNPWLGCTEGVGAWVAGELLRELVSL